MTTTAITSALLGTSSSSSSTSTASTSTTDFITLLLAEIANQDPTEPVSASDLTAQLATFTQVEQAIQSNTYLSALTDLSSSLNNAQSISCIGKTVTADTSTITHTEGKSEVLAFQLSGDAADAAITIQDADGNVIATIGASDLSSGTNSVVWDGTDASGNIVEGGTYTFTVSAADSSGSSVTASTSVTAAVTGVTYVNGVAYLVTDYGNINYGNVTKISST